MDQLSRTSVECTTRVRHVEASHIADMMRIADETNLSPWSAQNYLDELKNPDAIMLRLVADDNSTLGFVVGRVVIGGQIEAQVNAEIYNIAVAREDQGKGHGQSLFDAFVDACGQRDVVQVWLEVRQSNHKAIAFYKKNGFSLVQTRNHFYENPREHALLMKRNLRSASA
jgi:[ribosomal protein S18]-alanine N-acetyltransferase